MNAERINELRDESNACQLVNPALLRECLDELESAQAELAALKEQVRWRPYPQEKPVVGYWYLCAEFDPDDRYHRWDVFFYGFNNSGWLISEPDALLPMGRFKVTNWMPLPLPPSPDAKEEK